MDKQLPCGCDVDIRNGYVHGYKRECPEAHAMFTRLIEARVQHGSLSPECEAVSEELRQHAGLTGNN